jgi:hypothetical protein
MKKMAFVVMLGAAWVLMLAGCVQNVAPPDAKTVKLTVPNLLSG